MSSYNLLYSGLAETERSHHEIQYRSHSDSPSSHPPKTEGFREGIDWLYPSRSIWQIPITLGAHGAYSEWAVRNRQ